MALNLSLMTAQSAKGLPDVAITRRTIDFDRGMMANSPALAAPAPGPNLEKVEDFFRILPLYLDSTYFTISKGTPISRILYYIEKLPFAFNPYGRFLSEPFLNKNYYIHIYNFLTSVLWVVYYGCISLSFTLVL